MSELFTVGHTVRGASLGVLLGLLGGLTGSFAGAPPACKLLCISLSARNLYAPSPQLAVMSATAAAATAAATAAAATAAALTITAAAGQQQYPLARHVDNSCETMAALQPAGLPSVQACLPITDHTVASSRLDLLCVACCLCMLHQCSC